MLSRSCVIISDKQLDQSNLHTIHKPQTVDNKKHVVTHTNVTSDNVDKYIVRHVPIT